MQIAKPSDGGEAGVIDLAVARTRADRHPQQDLAGCESRDVICSCRIHGAVQDRAAIGDDTKGCRCDPPP